MDRLLLQAPTYMERMLSFSIGATLHCSLYRFSDKRICVGTPGSQRYLSNRIARLIQTTSPLSPFFLVKTLRLVEISSFLHPPMVYYVLLMRMKAMRTKLLFRSEIWDRASLKPAGSMVVGNRMLGLLFGPRRIWKHLALGQAKYVHSSQYNLFVFDILLPYEI